MNWDALYVAVALMVIVIFILLTVIETPAEREAKEAFFILQEMNVSEALFRLQSGLKPVIL